MTQERLLKLALAGLEAEKAENEKAQSEVRLKLAASKGLLHDDFPLIPISTPYPKRSVEHSRRISKALKRYHAARRRSHKAHHSVG